MHREEDRYGEVTESERCELVLDAVFYWEPLELNLELRSSNNATTVVVAKITGERGWRVGRKKKVSFRRFLADQKIASSWKHFYFGASRIARLRTHSDYEPPKMFLKLAV